jgi:arsenate reductase (thioredoxin)
MKKDKVLFLCTGNSCRSQMAEAFLRQIAGDHFEVFSAGLEPTQIHPLTYKVMAEKGLDLAGQRTKSLNEYLGKMTFDYLITVCDDADKNCPTLLTGVISRMHWPFEDPAKFTGSDAEKLQKFREVRDLIEQRISDWVA